jgi:hypothetical protein
MDFFRALHENSVRLMCWFPLLSCVLVIITDTEITRQHIKDTSIKDTWLRKSGVWGWASVEVASSAKLDQIHDTV